MGDGVTTGMLDTAQSEWDTSITLTAVRPENGVRAADSRPLCGICRKRKVRKNSTAGRCDACRKFAERYGYDRPPEGYPHPPKREPRD